MVTPVLLVLCNIRRLPQVQPSRLLEVFGLAVSATMAGAGPFSTSQSPSTVVVLQAFIGSLALASLFLALPALPPDAASAGV